MFKTFLSPKHVILHTLHESRGDVNDENIPAFGAVIGKFSPLTIGHKKMIDLLTQKCAEQELTPVICIIDTQGVNNTDRLMTGAERKQLIMNQYGGDIEVMLVGNAFQALVNIKETGGNLELILCGDDRVEKYKQLSATIFDQDYQDTPPNVISLPRSNEDDPTSMASSTKARQAAKIGDIEKFSHITGLSGVESMQLMKLLQDRMG